MSNLSALALSSSHWDPGIQRLAVHIHSNRLLGSAEDSGVTLTRIGQGSRFVVSFIRKFQFVTRPVPQAASRLNLITILKKIEWLILGTARRNHTAGLGHVFRTAVGPYQGPKQQRNFTTATRQSSRWSLGTVAWESNLGIVHGGSIRGIF
jgi:hypothetical protein